MRALITLSRLTRRLLPSLAASHAPRPLLLRGLHGESPPPPPPFQAPPPIASRILQSELEPSADAEQEGDAEQPDSDPDLDEFLARFVAKLRPILAAAFPTNDRHVLDEMLRLVAEAVMCRLTGVDPGDDAVELSDDLWAAVWEVSASVRDGMQRDRVRAELRDYLHCDEVKEMTRFAADVGIRGDMLRELRFKWAREKLEEVEFYRGLDDMRAQAEAAANPVALPAPRLTALPQRKGEIKFKIHGLDLSDPTWGEVVERAAEAEAHFVPEEAKAVEGKAKKAEEKLLAVDPRKGDPVPAMEEWKDELWPKRADWMALLERVKARNVELYLKVAEILLAEESFGATIRDYSKLIDLHSKANHVEDAERILGKMKEKGISPDVLISITLVHMYSKVGNLEQANQAFQFLKGEGFPPDIKLFTSMINAHLKSGDLKRAENLLHELEKSLKPTKELYMDVIQAFAEHGMTDGAERVKTMMFLAGYQPTPELFTSLIEAYGRTGHSDCAYPLFEQMRRSGHEPDDRCLAGMMLAYMTKNQLDKALKFLLNLEKDGLKPGVKTNLVLLDWLSRLQLVQESEQLVQKIRKAGEEPMEMHVFLADMYAKSRQEERARKSLKILEEKKKVLKAEQFERIIGGLLEGGFTEEANKYFKMMKARGFVPSPTIEIGVKASFGVKGGVNPRHRG
ncbi:pentatricopeptide repeat-containing protein At3g16010 [Oryza brachyantha]|uniref:Pentacotripeptide-repeat region of PRORP domain-containing protein n=1 Tax=Oryza brachyantha TaxID=4533 RepID=J3LEN9_ORYBR|nr:pentatricopeptide repeat-containing protein At3g16010 [Oryza brachyantha]